MAETVLAAREPFADSLPAGRLGHLGGAPGVIVAPREPAGAVMLLGAADTLGGLGCALPEPRRWTGSAEWQAFSVGPERWLLFGPPDAARLAQDRLGPAACLVDQSDARAILTLRGARVRDVLAQLVAIDLHPRAFRPGDVAATQAGHMGCLLWQIDDAPSFGLAVARGYAGSLAHWLIEASAEVGLLVER